MWKAHGRSRAVANRKGPICPARLLAESNLQSLAPDLLDEAVVLPTETCAATKHNMLQVTPISDDDYFTRNPEFSTWLRERRKVSTHGSITRSTMQPCAQSWCSL